MADKYTPEMATSGKEWLRTWWKKVENNFTKIFGAVNKHIDGTTDRHTADMIDYSDTETVKAKLDSTDTKLDTKVDKVSGKGLVDETDIRTAVQSDNLTLADEKKITLRSTESGDTGTNVINAVGMTVGYNNMKTTIGCDSARFSFTDTNENVFITPNDVTINQGGKTVHKLSEKIGLGTTVIGSTDKIRLESADNVGPSGIEINPHFSNDIGKAFIKVGVSPTSPSKTVVGTGSITGSDMEKSFSISGNDIVCSPNSKVTHRLSQKVDKVEGKSLIDENVADNLTYDSTNDIINSSANLLLENSASVAAYNGTFRGDIKIGQLGANKWAYRISPITGFSTSVDVTCTSGNKVHSLANKADSNDVLTKTNTAEFTPTADYQPATKKYVDDAIKTAIEKYNTEAMALLGED